MQNVQRDDVSSLGNALELLGVIAEHGAPIGLSELSRRSGLAPSTVHRLLATLLRRGFVSQDAATRRYRLGLRLFELGSQAIGQLDVRAVVRPYLQALAEELGETVSLAVRDRNEVVYVDRVDGKGVVAIATRLGGRSPLHCTAVGKAILALEPEPIARQLLGDGPLPAQTPRTVVRSEVLLAQLAEIRARGYASVVGELVIEVNSVGAGMRDHTGSVVGGIGVAGLATRLRGARLDRIGRRVAEVALDVSQQLGAPAVRGVA